MESVRSRSSIGRHRSRLRGAERGRRSIGLIAIKLNRNELLSHSKLIIRILTRGLICGSEFFSLSPILAVDDVDMRATYDRREI